MARNGCYFMSDRKKEKELVRFCSLFNEGGGEGNNEASSLTMGRKQTECVLTH